MGLNLKMTLAKTFNLILKISLNFFFLGLNLKVFDRKIIFWQPLWLPWQDRGITNIVPWLYMRSSAILPGHLAL